MLPAQYGDPKKINDDIDRQLKLASNLIKLAKSQGIPKIGAYVKEKYDPSIDLNTLAAGDFRLKTGFVPENKKKRESFFLHLDDYVKSKEKKVKKATLGVYGQMARHLEAFQIYRKQEITFASLDY